MVASVVVERGAYYERVSVEAHRISQLGASSGVRRIQLQLLCPQAIDSAEYIDGTRVSPGSVVAVSTDGRSVTRKRDGDADAVG